MPLDKSGSAASVGKNITTEMSAGNKPRKQAIAIALSVKRRANGQAASLGDLAPKRGWPKKTQAY